MDRRKFLRQTTAAGIGITALGAFPLAAQASETSPGETFAGAENDAFALNEMTIDQLQEKMQRGELTARSITEQYLARIAAIDKSGVQLNAIIELNPDALAIADQLDKERAAKKVRGPLHGIPVLIKDNINSGDKMQTTAGALALEGNMAAKDAFLLKQLRDAGAILLGKTNLSEWANFRSTRATSGWSSRGGQTKNPCVLDRSPCGSSSGSAAAVAANLCVVAVGSETDGSITAPASFCGIVGMKPTVGLISRSGIIPISKTQDTAGPMARTVKDLALLLGAMTGVDAADGATAESKSQAKKDYTKLLDGNALKGKRIGVEKSFLEGHPGVVNLLKQAMVLMSDLGAELIEVNLLEKTRGLGDAELAVLEYEFKDGVNHYLAAANAKVKSLAEVIAWNTAHAAKAMPFFAQELLETCEATDNLQNKTYTEALAKTTGARAIIDELMKTNQLDAIAGTTIGLPFCIDLVNGDYDTGFYFGSPAAMAGYPHISVPMGRVHELPVGLSFIAGAWKEAELLSFAYAYEQSTKHRAAPQFLKTVSN